MNELEFDVVSPSFIVCIVFKKNNFCIFEHADTAF